MRSADRFLGRWLRPALVAGALITGGLAHAQSPQPADAVPLVPDAIPALAGFDQEQRGEGSSKLWTIALFIGGLATFAVVLIIRRKQGLLLSPLAAAVGKDRLTVIESKRLIGGMRLVLVDADGRRVLIASNLSQITALDLGDIPKSPGESS